MDTNQNEPFLDAFVMLLMQWSSMTIFHHQHINRITVLP